MTTQTTFQVNDIVNALFCDSVEHVGRIVAMDGNQIQLETKRGEHIGWAMAIVTKHAAKEEKDKFHLDIP